MQAVICTNACTKPSDVCHLSYPQLLSCAYSYKYLEVLWLPKRTQLWACFNTEPNRLYRRLRLFPSKLQEYTPPPFSRLSTQYHIDPLLACLLSLATSRRVCDYSGVQSSVTGILRMGYMNIHITWLTHVRTGPKKKIAAGQCLVSSPDQIFRARPADSSKNRVWTLSLRKLGQVYIWRAVNWVIVGVNYIISNQQRLLWRQKNLQAGYL